jgi:hypothetical protein
LAELPQAKDEDTKHQMQAKLTKLEATKRSAWILKEINQMKRSCQLAYIKYMDTLFAMVHQLHIQNHHMMGYVSACPGCVLQEYQQSNQVKCTAPLNFLNQDISIKETIPVTRRTKLFVGGFKMN